MRHSPWQARRTYDLASPVQQAYSRNTNQVAAQVTPLSKPDDPVGVKQKCSLVHRGVMWWWSEVGWQIGKTVNFLTKGELKMEPDENHRSANPCEVDFTVWMFDDLIQIKVTAEIMETYEGAEVKILKFELYDLGLEEFVDITAECNEKFSPEFLYEIEDEAFEKWEAQK